MAKNWAICIGINQYRYIGSLEYAVRDAEQMSIWFEGQGTFEKVYLFTDKSDPIPDMNKDFPSNPTYSNLLEWMGQRFKKREKPPLSSSDNLWFFFSGHGCRYGGQDFLMFSDTNSISENIDKTAISIDYMTELFRNSGAGNIILFIDACRDSAKRGSGLQLSKQQGIIAISSCSPDELSHEIKELEHGSFTYALLESLKIQGEGNCATVERLCQRLRYRIREIHELYKKPRQIPYEVIEPASKYHLILLPSQATVNDVAALKVEAYRAEDEDIELAEKLWVQVLVASPADMDALAKLRKIWVEGLKWKHKSQIQELEVLSETKKEEIHQLYQTQMQELEQLNQTNIRKLETDYQTKAKEIKSAQAQFQQAKQNAEQSKIELRQLQQSHQAQIQELEESYQIQIRKLEASYRNKVKELENSQAQLQKIQQKSEQSKIEPKPVQQSHKAKFTSQEVVVHEFRNED
ncbi:MAG: caspase family protein [Cyanobacteria bacterium P01_F01_bin.143]